MSTQHYRFRDLANILILLPVLISAVSLKPAKSKGHKARFPWIPNLLLRALASWRTLFHLLCCLLLWMEDGILSNMAIMQKNMDLSPSFMLDAAALQKVMCDYDLKNMILPPSVLGSAPGWFIMRTSAVTLTDKYPNGDV